MVVRIPIEKRLCGFAQMLLPPEIVVFDLFLRNERIPTAEEIASAKSLFRIYVMNKALTSGGWPRVLVAPIRPE